MLDELDDRIEACQAKIHFNEQQIMALAPAKLKSDVGDASGAVAANAGVEGGVDSEPSFISTVTSLDELDGGSECA